MKKRILITFLIFFVLVFAGALMKLLQVRGSDIVLLTGVLASVFFIYSLIRFLLYKKR